MWQAAQIKISKGRFTITKLIFDFPELGVIETEEPIRFFANSVRFTYMPKHQKPCGCFDLKSFRCFCLGSNRTSVRVSVRALLLAKGGLGC
jgi:hypothetical protein